ncbi:MAG: poly-gamma-glutamate synthase PgsB [Bacillota bacterium]|nr:poly-gamma-glutamate synthase PgsB [Bacillota bacterium]
MLEPVILALVLIEIGYLIYEDYKNKRNRKKLKALIHVNGIRGKSTVTRLIHSGLKAKGARVFAKTTGTLPMTINNNKEEDLIIRKARSNIKEQIKIIEGAVKDQADYLVVECMAVNPILQKVSQEKILYGDIGVLTNIRLDHTEEMGQSLLEIGQSLSSFIPKNGILVTSEEKYYPMLEQYCKKVNTKIIKAKAKEAYAYINFPENVACAVEVCKLFNIDEDSALKAMETFVRDPYDLRVFEFDSGGIFINGLSINDPDSSKLVYKRLIEKYAWTDKSLVLLINNRPDRGYRAQHMIDLTKELRPDQILLCGSFSKYLLRHLQGFDTRIIKDIKDLDFSLYGKDQLIYAVGNIANHGDEILEKVRKEAREYV